MIPFRRPRTPRSLELAFAAALGLGFAFGSSGCDPNALSPLLVPTGGGQTGSCTSGFTSVRMVGDFTSPAFSIPISPAMELVRVNGVCVWRGSVQLNAGPVLFKFVTNDAFDDDFVGDEAVSLAVPGGPYVTSIGSGSGNAIKIDVATAGEYVFLLDERTLTWKAEAGAPPLPGGISGSVSFANLTSAPYPVAKVVAHAGTTPVDSTTSDPTTRAFTIPGLPAGTYRVLVSASCFTTLELPIVPVSGGTTDVGDVALAEGASSSTTIDLIGGFNIFTPGVDPMVEAPACVWTRERFLNAGVYGMKFAINGQFEPNYGGDDTVAIPIPGGGAVQRFETGGTSIQIEVANSGTYRFVLDERLQRWDAIFVSPAPAGAEER